MGTVGDLFYEEHIYSEMREEEEYGVLYGSINLSGTAISTKVKPVEAWCQKGRGILQSRCQQCRYGLLKEIGGDRGVCYHKIFTFEPLEVT